MTFTEVFPYKCDCGYEIQDHEDEIVHLKWHQYWEEKEKGVRKS